MKKPVIILTPQSMPMEAPFRGSYHYTNAFNTAAVLRAGGIPLLPPFLEEEDARGLLEQADGLFMTGGADIAPAIYGETPLPQCGTVQPERDRSDCALLQAALELKKPVLCICRGAQLANGFLGGTLYQDLPSQFESSLCHSASEAYEEGVHDVQVDPDSPLYALLGRDRLRVNSLHHQAVRTLAPGLKAMAWAPDGLVESYCMENGGQWLRGYQWHPELQKDRTQETAIFAEFIRECSQKY